MVYSLLDSDAVIYKRRQNLLQNRFGFPNPFRTEVQILSDRIMELLFYSNNEITDLRSWQMNLHCRYFLGVPEDDFASMIFFDQLIECLESVYDLTAYEEGLLDALLHWRGLPALRFDDSFPEDALYYFINSETYNDGLLAGQIIGEMLCRMHSCLQQSM